jgi:hypothetical protein
MSSPLVVERVVRAILRSFVHAGIVSSYVDTAKIEAIPANYSDAQIDAVLNTIVFSGSAAASDILRSTGDVNVFVDSDNNDGWGTFVRYFRVAQDQTDPPVVDAMHELMTVGMQSFGEGIAGSILTVGPRADLATGNNTSAVKLGAQVGDYYGQISAGPVVNNGGTGLKIESSSNIGIAANAIRAYDITGLSVRGGFSQTATMGRFHVGDYTASDSLIVETEAAGAFSYYNIRPDNNDTTVKRIYIRGSGVSPDYRVQVLVGGKYGETYGDPANLGQATLSVIGDTVSAAGTAANTMFVYDRRDDRGAGTEIFTVKSATAAGGNYYLMRCYVQAVPVFRVKSDGSISISGAGPLGTGAGDVAEMVPTDVTYAPGTVLVARTGVITAATEYAQVGVVGVVSACPGVEIGQEALFDTSSKSLLQPLAFNADTKSVRVVGQVIYAGTHVLVGEHYFVEVLYTEYDAAKDETLLILEEAISIAPNDEAKLYCGIVRAPHHAKLAVTGVVPVTCSSDFGPILGNGEWLVAGPDGVAVVSDVPVPGATLGKALSALTTDVGTVRMLVCLR